MNAPIIDVERAVRTFDAQSNYCTSAGAHSYAAILKGLIAEIRAGGLMHELLCHWDGAPEGLIHCEFSAPYIAWLWTAKHRRWLLYCQRPAKSLRQTKSGQSLGIC